MYVLDRDADRRWRPWHVVAGIDRYVIYATCSKVFDVRPGATTTGAADDSVVCGLCLATCMKGDDGQQLPLQTIWWKDGIVVRDNTSHVLRTYDHIADEDVAEALDIRAAFESAVFA